MASYRVLVTGSRDYADGKKIVAVFANIGSHHPEGVIVVDGQCDPVDPVTGRRVDWALAESWPVSEQKRLIGADWLCDRIATFTFGWQVERHPAQWARLGKGAGFARNTGMAQAGADEGLAFGNWCRDRRCPRRGQHVSHGTAHAASEFERFGIPVRRFGLDPQRAG